jgi:hypothetical protein
MPLTQPDHQTLVAAIELANRAPSVHDTQPWRWLLGAESLHLMADRTRQVPVIDPDGRDLLLSCGAALHHLKVALAALGWRTTVRHLPNHGDPDHLAAVETRPHVSTGTDIAFVGAISRRRTDRRRFTSGEVPGDHLDLMARRAARAGALLVPVTAPVARWRLSHAITTAARQQAGDSAYRAELVAWTGRNRTGGVLADAPTGRGERDAGELLVVATLADDPVSILRAGEAASVALLTATDLGMATCLLSQPLEVADTRAAIRDEVLDGAAYPQLILRTGWAPISAPPLPLGPVRRTEDTIDYLPGTRRPPHHGIR